MFRKLSNFQQRCLFGTIAGIITGCAIAYSHEQPLSLLFVILLAALQAVALWEYYSLATTKRFAPLKGVGIGFSIAYIFLRYATAHIPHCSFLAVALCALFVTVAFCCHFSSVQGAIANLAVTVFGPLYITIPLGFIVDINYFSTPSSSIWLVYLLIATKTTDMAAYFAGKKWGKTPLAATLSPKKTVEGAKGGLIGTLVITFLFFIIARLLGYLTHPACTYPGLFELLVVGAAVSIAAQIGDLAESLIKRDATTKDSSSLPGFGGVLDIVDSLIFTTPLLYIWLEARSV